MNPSKGPSKRMTPPAAPRPANHQQPYQNTALAAAGLPEQFFFKSDEQQQQHDHHHHHLPFVYDPTAGLTDTLLMPFGATPPPSSCGGGPAGYYDDTWTWAASDISTASNMPSLDAGSTISNVSTRSTETITAGNNTASMSAMMPPARPHPSTRASSLDFSAGGHPPPNLALHRLESPALLSEISDASSPRLSPARAATATAGGSSSSSRNRCSWAGCMHLHFPSHEELVWHVKADHLLVCPAPGCVETTFVSARHVTTHLAVAHPELGLGEVKEWSLDKQKLSPPVVEEAEVVEEDEDEERSKTPQPVVQSLDQPRMKQKRPSPPPASVPVEDPMTKELLSVATSKRKCQEQLRSAIEKRAKKRANTTSDFCPSPHSTFTSVPSPSDLVRSRAVNLIETVSFPLVYEHMILPFLAEFLPRWTSPKHVVSVIRGKSRDSRRICILTEADISFARKIIIARHVTDLLPENQRPNVSFVFATGEVVRTQQTWARGVSRDQLDDICTTRNPYYYRSPCMGDSIGIPEQAGVDEATATLGPCLSIDGGSYWLSNFHPFLDAYQSLETIRVEHPSPQDRAGCLEEAHDALSPDANYAVGDVTVTSGLTLHTTRVSHEPYWEECAKDQPLVVTDWALITASASRANILRRFPSDLQPTRREPLVRFASAVMPGAPVCSSGRTSGFQRGQVCEIPAYVSGVANGTGKATREWFVEEPYNCEDEEDWIRGGIGVSGDSGAAVVDSDTNCIIGQIWGRNKYWGPGPRQAFFTPISDVFDDIQEKCGQQDRPQLPQLRDEADTYPILPTCRQCYDLQAYNNSRRSSRMSLQSMIMGRMDGDQDLTSIEAVSELATPRDRGMGLEETGSVFNNINSIFSPSQLGGANTPVPLDARSPYAPMLIIDEEQQHAASTHAVSRKRSAQLPMFAPDETKRPRVDGEL